MEIVSNYFGFKFSETGHRSLGEITDDNIT